MTQKFQSYWSWNMCEVVLEKYFFAKMRHISFCYEIFCPCIWRRLFLSSNSSPIWARRDPEVNETRAWNQKGCNAIGVEIKCIETARFRCGFIAHLWKSFSKGKAVSFTYCTCAKTASCCGNLLHDPLNGREPLVSGACRCAIGQALMHANLRCPDLFFSDPLSRSGGPWREWDQQWLLCFNFSLIVREVKRELYFKTMGLSSHQNQSEQR